MSPETIICGRLFWRGVFESDQDIDPRAAYLCYDDRWLLELVFNRYKSDECLGQVGGLLC